MKHDDVFPTYEFSGKPIRLNTFGMIKNCTIPDYNFISSVIDPRIINKIQACYQTNDSSLAAVSDIYDDNHNMIPGYCSNWGEITYLFCRVYAERDMDVLCTLPLCGFYRMFINDKIAYISETTYHGVLTYHLQQGYSIIIIELPMVNNFPVSLRLSKLGYDKECTSVDYQNYYLNNEFARIFNFNENLWETKSSVYMLIPLNCVELNLEQNILVTKTQKRSGKIIGRQTVKFFEPLVYNISEYCFQEDVFDFVEFKFEYYDKSKTKRTLYTYSYPINSSVSQDSFKKELLGLLSTEKNEQNRCALEYYCREPKYGNMITHHSMALRYILNNKTPENIYTPGFHQVFYYSKLDDSYEYYSISLPANFRVNKLYPLVIFIPYQWHKNYSKYMQQYDTEEVVFADIFIRGMNTGSYIGEAAMLEVIQKISKTFPIDRKRIYVIGTSSGAYACYSLAQNHPHLTAAICAASGRAYLPNIRNLFNVRVVNISSKTESMYEATFHIPKNQLCKIDDYSPHELINMTHHDLLFTLCKKEYIDELLSKRFESPKKIKFRTENHRHRRAYWLEIQKISFKKRFAEIYAYVDTDSLHIQTKNVDGFSVDTPSFLKNRPFKIVVNKANTFEINSNDTVLHFIKKKQFILTNTPLRLNTQKGTGLLDMYLKELRIFTDNDDQLLMEVAQSFSKPYLNSVDPNLYVKYPIMPYASIEQYPDCNLLIITGEPNDMIPKHIKDRLPIQMSENGFVYKGRYYQGKYCTMQVITSIFDCDKSIVYISTNDRNLMKKNFFIRKVILPSYANGFHPYWNNEALIFDGKKYYGIYEWGMDMEEIK